MKWSVVLVLAVLAVGSAACDKAEKKQDAVPAVTPSADEVLEAYVKALGGRDAFAKVDVMRVKGAFELKKQGLRGNIVLAQARPNKSYSRMEMKGMGVSEDGCDGTTCWKKSESEGVRILAGDELVEELRNAILDSDVRWRELYRTVDVAGAVDFEGKPAWKVVYTPAAGPVESKYFDRVTHLMLGEDSISVSQSGERKSRIRVLEWGTFGELKQPKKILIAGEGMDMHLDVDNIEINPTVDPAMFELPADVKALRDAP